MSSTSPERRESGGDVGQVVEARPLLTIAIPTYNRSGYLARLLDALGEETAGLAGLDILVSDNASTDDTFEIVAEAQRRQPDLRSFRNPSNVGPDENFCLCIDRALGAYIWILSDDDMPKRGVVRLVFDLLRHEQPELVYMESEWLNFRCPSDGEPVPSLTILWPSRLKFARQVHIWTTYISGFIIQEAALQRALVGRSLRRHCGTHLAQLGWILPVVTTSARIAYLSNKCLLATPDNSIGYSHIQVFGVGFAQIVHAELGSSKLARSMIARAISRYLPRRIWGARIADERRFASEFRWNDLRRVLGRHAGFWLVLTPLAHAPLPIAKLAIRVARAMRTENFRRVSRG